LHPHLKRFVLELWNLSQITEVALKSRVALTPRRIRYTNPAIA
jgi:hypothetical protein